MAMTDICGGGAVLGDGGSDFLFWWAAAVVCGGCWASLVAEGLLCNLTEVGYGGGAEAVADLGFAAAALLRICFGEDGSGSGACGGEILAVGGGWADPPQGMVETRGGDYSGRRRRFRLMVAQIELLVYLVLWLHGLVRFL